MRWKICNKLTEILKQNQTKQKNNNKNRLKKACDSIDLRTSGKFSPMQMVSFLLYLQHPLSLLLLQQHCYYITSKREDERAKVLGMIVKVLGTNSHPATHPTYETWAKEAETNQFLDFNL